jgi:NADH dehydrogenase
MTRAPVSDRIVTVFGGSGFVGRHVVRVLAKRGWRIRAAVRRPELAGHLQPLGAVGQIHAVQANLRSEASVRRAVEGADAVVNLVGILAEAGRQRFDDIQARGPGLVAEAAIAAGITGFVHQSALGADPDSPSAYARSKAAGERAVFERMPGAIVTRPSIVFGPEDRFFNLFAAMARLSPVLPLIGGGATRFQPVFVGDVAEVIARGVDGLLPPGVYELGGAEVMSFRQVLDYVLAVTGRRRLLVPLPFWAARMQAGVLQLMPKPLLTVDQVRMLETDNLVSPAAAAAGATLAGLGIEPTLVESVVPSYLYRFRAAGQFERVPEDFA